MTVKKVHRDDRVTTAEKVWLCVAAGVLLVTVLVIALSGQNVL